MTDSSHIRQPTHPVRRAATGRRRPGGLRSSRATRFATGALMTLLVLELGARWIEPAVAVEPRYYEAGAQVTVERLEALGGDDVDVLFAGSSVVKHGFDPARFEEFDAQGRSAFNAGINGAVPDVNKRFLAEEVLPRVRPDLVVYGVASNDMHLTPRRRQVVEKYGEAPATDRSIVARLRRATVERLALFRTRAAVRDPDELWESVGRRLDGERGPAAADLADERRLLSEEGYSHRFDDREYSDELGPALRRDLRGFDIEAGRAAALSDIVDGLRRRGIDVVLAIAPVTGDYQSYHPTEDGGYEEFRAGMRELADRLGVPLVDLSDAVPGVAGFADPYHLNGQGAVVATRALAGELAAAGR